MTKKVIWLAAYPKTGSSWVRIIIHELLGLHGAIRDDLPSFGRTFPTDAPSYRLMGLDAKLLRTHFRPTHRNFQTVQNELGPECVGVMTVRRHPLDVLLSQLNYAYIKKRRSLFINQQRKTVEQIVLDGEIERYIGRFLAAGGCPERLGRCGAYGDFYAEWRTFAVTTPHLHLRYEEMVANPGESVGNIASFLALRVNCTASVLANVERRTQLDGEFFWRKRAFNFREMLSAATVARFESAYAEPLRRMGY